MVVIAVFNMIAWIGDVTKGKSESPMYYILIFMILGGGIWLISIANTKKKNEKNLTINKSKKNKRLAQFIASKKVELIAMKIKNP